jgi:hypothetical protein
MDERGTSKGLNKQWEAVAKWGHRCNSGALERQARNSGRVTKRARSYII